MSEFEPIKRLNYLGGMNRLPLQGTSQVHTLKNMRPLRTGGLQVRGGQTLEHSIGGDPTAGSITDLFGYRTSALGTRLYNLRRTGDGDKVFDNTTEVTGPTLSGAVHTAIVEGKGTIFVSDGNSADIQYHVPGTSVRSAITNSFSGESLPQCQFLKVYRNRLYAWTDTGLRYTNAGLYSTLPAVHFADANLIQVREENAEARGIAAGEDALVLFTPNSYSIMTGTPGNNGARGTHSLVEYQGVGCGFPRTVASKGRNIFWLDPERRAKMLEGPVLRDLDEQDFVAEFFQAADDTTSASAIFLGRELWVSLPKSSASNDRRILVYDLALEVWVAEFTGIEGYAMTYLPEINSVFVGSHTGGYIWRQANGRFQPTKDVGSLIPVEMIEGQVVFGTVTHKKFYDKILVSLRLQASESLNFSYSKDELDDFTSFELNSTLTQTDHNWGDDLWGEYTWGGATGMQVHILRYLRNSNLLAMSSRLKIAGSLSGGTVIYGTEHYGSSLDRDGESGIV